MSGKFEKQNLKKKSEDFAGWYTDVILKSELADYAPVRGCMVIRPYGYSLWEGIQKYMDPFIKERGVQNAYFPLFIPESFLQREKDHVEGFAPEAAIVTLGGGEELKERLYVRPTSETVMYEMYKQWTQSYRDLPVLVNQWNNVVRWEKRTYLFLRTSEFLWQEGHCAHETNEESQETVEWALKLYERTYREVLAVYGIPGVKSESEKFAGADKTYTYEMLMPDGKALQGCTSHDLGQNFAKAFDWTVSSREGGKLYPWQNSWGFSTRSIGGLVMAHGDDDGLVLPPKIAPIKLVILPVLGKGDDTSVIEYCLSLKESLDNNSSNFPGRVEVWGSDGKYGEKTLGWKISQAEVMGIPLEITIGPKEVTSGEFQISYRIHQAQGVDDMDFPNRLTNLNSLSSDVEEMLSFMQIKLLDKHKDFTEKHTHVVDNYDQFKGLMSSERGFIKAFWCEGRECEAKIKEETKASTRCLPLDSVAENGKCVYCGKDAKYRWIFAQSY